MSQIQQLIIQISDIDTLLQIREMNLVQRWKEVKKHEPSTIMRISTLYWHYDYTDLLDYRSRLLKEFLTLADITELESILQINK